MFIQRLQWRSKRGAPDPDEVSVTFPELAAVFILFNQKLKPPFL